MQATLRGSNVELIYPKNPEGVAALKRIPGARWERHNKRWVIPMTSYPEVVAFCESFAVPMSDDLAGFPMPKFNRFKSSIEVHGNRIKIDFPYDADGVMKEALRREVPLLSWDGKNVTRWAPIDSLPHAIEWAKRFGIDVPERLEAIARWRSVKAALDVADSMSVERVEISVPGLEAELDDHQTVALKYLLDHRQAIIGDDMGLGKTLEAMAAMELFSQDSEIYPLLVVSPPKLTVNWKAEYQRFLPHRTVQIVSKKADALLEPRADVTIIGHSIIAAKVEELVGFKALIADESHAFKTSTAQRTRALKRISKMIDGAKLLCTGTPATIGPSDLVPQLEVVGLLDRFISEHDFYKRYCDLKKTRRSNYDFSGAINLDELNFRLRSIGYIRRERDQALNLPEVMHFKATTALEGALADEYARAEADIIAYLVNRATEIAIELGEDVHSAAVRARMKAEAGRHLVKFSTLRGILGKGKIPFAVEWVQSRIDEGRQVVVAAHHREVVSAIADKFGGLKIQGGQSADEVNEHKRQFQGGAPVITISIDAGGEGHTLTAAHDMIFAELPTLSTKYDQAWGRIWRKGQTKRTTVTATIATGTIDDDTWNTLGIRRKQVRSITSGEPVDAAPSIVLSLLDRGLRALRG